MEKTLRIYFAISTFFPLVGGAETQTHAQCQRLRERGYEPTVVTFRHDASWLPYEVLDGVPVMRVAGLLLGSRKNLPRQLQQLLYMLAIFQMAWTLWQHRRDYDILHLIQFNLLVLPLALVCRLAGKPMIIAVRSVGPGKEVCLHNHLPLAAGPLSSSVPALRLEGFQYGGDLENFERWGKFGTRFTSWLLGHMPSVVVVLSSRMKVYLAAHNLHVPDVQLIPNGVNITHFRPDTVASQVAGQDQTVVCVSRLSHEKGIEVLLQAWHLIQKQMPQAKLIIVGIGPLQDQLKHIAHALDITGSVEFAGLQHDVPAQFHRGSLAVLPSHWEGMPNALLEAMACGRACVATRVSGSEDIIEHGVNGLLVEPGDYENMAKALLTLLSDPPLAKKYGHAARATIEQQYSMEHITDMYVELYERITVRRLQSPRQREYSPM